MNEMIRDMKQTIERNTLTKERKMICELLKKHNSLTEE